MSNHSEAMDPQGPPHIHHMDSNTAYHSAKFGMWLFLGTEILLFGGLFCAFAIYRWMYLEEYHHASKSLSVALGATNTVVLLQLWLWMLRNMEIIKRYPGILLLPSYAPVASWLLRRSNILLSIIMVYFLLTPSSIHRSLMRHIDPSSDFIAA